MSLLCCARGVGALCAASTPAWNKPACSVIAAESSMHALKKCLAGAADAAAMEISNPKYGPNSIIKE